VFKVELLAVAEAELADAFEWYENRLTGLGNKFYDEVNHLLNLIEANPYYFPIKYPGELYSASLGKFLYLIIYGIDEINSLIFL